MKNVFCPKCESKLNIDGNIIFSVKKSNGETGLVLLKNEPGDYSVKKHPSFDFEEGEMVHFFCPVCHANLADNEVDEHLIKFQRSDEDGKIYEVLFSGIAGEHSTYLIRDKNVEPYGEDSTKYKSHFGDNFHF
ncbi:MAG: hypothetical protein KKA84_14020 [Bacteroidetes bacterium]|nr:hypothetical protein [Bacteroidota bacterium]